MRRALAFTLLALSACGSPESPTDAQPGSIGDNPGSPGSLRPEKNFAFLVNNHAQGKASPTPWAGYWWPYKENGIAAGKYSGGGSPAGKYDAARGNRTNAQGWEVRNHGSAVPKIQGWWGHCNGWTAASALFLEPTGPVTVNGIRFEVSDQKGLLTEASMEASADFFGNRVDWGNDYYGPKFNDTIPNQYFLVLTNYMGRLRQAVLIDRYTGDQIWNQPLAGYRITYPVPADYLGADPRVPGVYRMMVTTKIWWMNDAVEPGIHSPPFDFPENDDNVIQSRSLKMEVWLDGPVVFGADGRVASSGNLVVTRDPSNNEYFVGGSWRMGDGYFTDAWPDYMWVPYSAMKPTDYANPEIDLEWLKDHLLVPGGRSDPFASPAPIIPAPSPMAAPSASPSNWPQPQPGTGHPIGNPTPVPTPTRP